MLGSTNVPTTFAQNPQKTVEVASQPAQKAEVTQKAEVAQKPLVFASKPSQLVLEAQQDSLLKPLINSSSLSLNIAKALVVFFIFVLAIDAVVIERRKIVRFVGHNFDHILFFTLILGLIILLSKGVIL